MRSVEPSPERFRSFTSGADPPAPLIMINLLRYREKAEYPADFHAEPCTGREAYQRYHAMAAFLKMLSEPAYQAAVPHRSAYHHEHIS